MEHGLPLLSPALEIAWLAVLAKRRHVPPNRAPAANLPRVVGGSPAQIVAAVPLEPPARILCVDPAVATPGGERLRGVDPEAVQPRVVAIGAQLRAGEPRLREFGAAVGHVLPAEDAEPQHLGRR